VALKIKQKLHVGFVFIGSTMELSTEADINDVNEYPHNDKPSAGMFDLLMCCILCISLFTHVPGVHLPHSFPAVVFLYVLMCCI